MKTNIEYYQHFTDSHMHAKFKMLRVKYGWEGEGKFWALNNIIGSSDNCKLDISRKFIVADILDLFGFTCSDFDEFINYLVEDCELLERENNFLMTETTQENLETTLKRRTKNRQNYTKRAGNQNSAVENDFSAVENQNSAVENTQSKVKESKVKETKEKESKVKGNSSSFFVKNLFLKNTKIQDPKADSQIQPVLKFLNEIPEAMSREQVEACITEAFQELPQDKGIKIEYLVSNVQRKITVKTEENLQQIKRKQLKQAEIDRKKEEKIKYEQEKGLDLEKLKTYKNYFTQNENEFNEIEKLKLLRFFQQNKILAAGSIIEPKMDKIFS